MPPPAMTTFFPARADSVAGQEAADAASFRASRRRSGCEAKLSVPWIRRFYNALTGKASRSFRAAIPEGALMTPYALLVAVLGFHHRLRPAASAVGGQAQPVPPPPLTREQMAQFLKTAKVIGHKGISRGVTNPARLTLSDGTLTHDAAFSRVNEHKPIMQFPAAGPSSISWTRTICTLAANAIAELLGIEDMFPRHCRARVGSRHGRPQLVARRRDGRGRSAEAADQPARRGSLGEAAVRCACSRSWWTTRTATSATS